MIRILIADDANLIRQALNIYFKVESDLEIVETVANGKAAIKLVGELNPDMVLMDMEMPEMDGLTSTQIIRKCFPRTKILVISSYNSPDYIAKALKAGASGYFIKSTPAEELSEAIRLIHKQDVKIIPTVSTEKSYRVLPASLIGTENGESNPELLLQKVYAQTRADRSSQTPELEQVISANSFYPDNLSSSEPNKWEIDREPLKLSSLPSANSQKLWASINKWTNTKGIVFLSVFSIAILLTNALKHRTTVKANAQIRTNENTVATVFPSQAPLLVKASVPYHDITKIETDQKVNLRVFGCPHNYYGTLEGKTVDISYTGPQFIPTDNTSISEPKQNSAMLNRAYEVTIEPASFSLSKDEKKCPLKSGMRARADIITKEETILAFLLRKAKLIN